MTVTLGRTALPVVDSMACPAVAIEIAPEQVPSSESAGGQNDFPGQVQVADDLVSALVEWRAEQSGGR
jgi:N-acetylmuramoyl-L-alanine amidase